MHDATIWTPGPWEPADVEQDSNHDTLIETFRRGPYFVRQATSSRTASNVIAIGVLPHNAPIIAAAPIMADALRAILVQVYQGKVLERDACVAQAATALRKAMVRL